MNRRHPAVRWAAEFAAAARNAARLVAGARLADGQNLHSLATDAETGLAEARELFGLPPQWVIGRRLTTVGDVAVIELRNGTELAAVLKLSRSGCGDDSLLSQQRTLQRLAADERLASWRRLLPEVVAHGMVASHVYSIESALSGTVGTSIPDVAATDDAHRHALDAISGLHRATGRVETASAELIDAWLEPALSLVAEVPALFAGARRSSAVERVREELRAALEGRGVWVSSTHGDYFPGNIFYGPSRTVEGIIDWGQAREDDPAVIDPMTLLLADRAGRQRSGIGGVVRDLCEGAPLSRRELALLEAHRAACPADPIPVAVMALLAWVRHVENNLRKSRRYAEHPVWIHRVVTPVLKSAGAPGPAPVLGRR